jgi:hypothetical protein
MPAPDDGDTATTSPREVDGLTDLVVGLGSDVERRVRGEGLGPVLVDVPRRGTECDVIVGESFEFSLQHWIHVRSENLPWHRESEKQENPGVVASRTIPYLWISLRKVLTRSWRNNPISYINKTTTYLLMHPNRHPSHHVTRPTSTYYIVCMYSTYGVLA